MTGHRTPATPERELAELRQRQADNRKARANLTAKLKRRARHIADLAARVALAARLRRRGVKRPWLVLAEADRAARAAQLERTKFRAVALTVLDKETGLPQRAVFGHDHGSTGDRPPYSGHTVTTTRGLAFYAALRTDPWGTMNGVHWTQTTWYEKVERVHALSPDLTSPGAHLRVCLGDLAVLVTSYGRRDGFRRYNGSGAAADAYAADAEARYPAFANLVKPRG